MAVSPQRVWSTNDLRPLREKWQEANEQSLKVGGGQIPGPMNEASLAEAQRRTEHLAKPAPWDAARAEAGRSLSEVAHRYWRAHAAIVDCQQKLARLGETGERAILRNITAEMLRPPIEPSRMLDSLFPAPQRKSHPSPHGLCLPELDSVPAYHEAAQAVTARALDLEATHARLRHALEFEVMSKPDQNRQLLLALARNVASDVAELRNRIAELERPAPSKRGKQRS